MSTCRCALLVLVALLCLAMVSVEARSRFPLATEGPRPVRAAGARNPHDHQRHVAHKTLHEQAGKPASLLAGSGASCVFNGLNGTCQTQASCLAGASQTSVLAPLCATAGEQCCIYQQEAAPGCGSAALLRAQLWANMLLDYCQVPQGGSQPWLPECPLVCNRAQNSEWNAYRSDCSGLVSFSYGVPAPGGTTRDFAPWNNDTSFQLPTAHDLQPGDPINSIPREHIMLFAGWGDAAHTYAFFFEEPDCGIVNPWARRIQSEVKINPQDGTIFLHANGMTFAPIRVNSNKNVC